MSNYIIHSYVITHFYFSTVAFAGFFMYFSQALQTLSAKTKKMKKITSFPVAIFLGGIVAGILMTGLMAFTLLQSPVNPAGPAGQITPEQAHQLVINHVKANSKPTKVVEAISIDTAQFNAMRKIIDHETGVAAFRVYFGLVNGKEKVAIVVALDAAGKESVKNVVLTPLTRAGLCPTICDEDSPIFYQQ